MIKLRRISVPDNATLHKMMLAQLHDLGGGIELLEAGLSTDAGPLCLGFDAERRFVVLAAAAHEEDALLVQALAQMNWLSRHRPLMVRLFPRRGLESVRNSRAVLIAPSFSAGLHQAVGMIDLDVELIQYRALEVDQQKALLFEPVWIPRRKTGPEAITKPVSSSESPSRSGLTDEEREFFEGASSQSLPS